MKAIAIATTEGKCLPVLAASVTFYVPQDVTVFLAGSDIIFPRHRTVNLPNDATNFGDAYNAVVKRAFEEVDEVVCCNDDIVFNPYTWQTLAEDISLLRRENNPLGWVACRSDYARGYQNIRVGKGDIGDGYANVCQPGSFVAVRQLRIFTCTCVARPANCEYIFFVKYRATLRTSD